LDLPIKYKDVVYNVLIVKHKDIRLFKWATYPHPLPYLIIP
jgi:hypothetical protein